MQLTSLKTGILLSLLGLTSAQAADFWADSTLSGGIYYWQRERDRRDMNKDSAEYGKYTTNLTHSTANANLDFSSGYLADVLGVDLAAFTAWEIADAHDSSHPNEMAFSTADRTYDENWKGDKSGISLYKAAIKLKYGPFWLRGGYIQPAGQTLLAPHWSFLPGTYRGAEAGMIFDYGDAGELKFSYLWTDHYKAPWHLKMDNFRQFDQKTIIPWLHAIGAKYDFKNGLTLEASAAQAKGSLEQYFAKVGWQHKQQNTLLTSYQFYAAHSQRVANPDNMMYDGLAWMQALTLSYYSGPWKLRMEGSITKANGNQGYFLKRITRTYASSNGRLDIYWDNRSDFNANGEKALYAGVLYSLENWGIPGLAIGGSYVYGWDARPATNAKWDQSQRVTESAVSADVQYTVQQGSLKDTKINLHVTWYDNHSDIPSGKNGFGNLFQDEHDVKLIIMAPFTIFSAKK